MIDVPYVTIYEVYFRFPGDPVGTCYRTNNYGRALEFIKMIMVRDYVLDSFTSFGLPSEESLNEYVEDFIP